MERIYEFVEIERKQLNALFDSGVVRGYITRESA